MFARLIPRSQSTEFFGFFNMVGKFAAILGPLLMAIAPAVIPGVDERDAILVMVGLFVAGGFLLTRVDIAGGIASARAIRFTV